MTPEAADSLLTARRHLADATAIAAMGIAYVAAREAYLGAFHAAEALLNDRTGKIAKTHRGVRSEFARLAKSEPSIDPSFTRFLAEAYELKSVADYGMQPATKITADGALETIQTASRLVDCIEALLSREPP